MRHHVPGSAPGILFQVISFFTGSKPESLYQRLLRYIDEAHRDGVIGDGRYAVAQGKAGKLRRFLHIIGRPSISASEFTTDMMLEFRQFIADEYKYVPLYPDLYPRGSGHHWPTKRLRDTTVVHDLKLLQAFFAELENTDEIRRSPFRKLSMEKRRIIIHDVRCAGLFESRGAEGGHGDRCAFRSAMGEGFVCAELRDWVSNWRFAQIDDG